MLVLSQYAASLGFFEHGMRHARQRGWLDHSISKNQQVVQDEIFYGDFATTKEFSLATHAFCYATGFPPDALQALGTKFHQSANLKVGGMIQDLFYYPCPC